jgi:C4-dicarboxylate-specific signal transduction histidine kinase
MVYIYAVKRTTIFLDDQTLRQLQRVAQRKHVSAATLVREAVARYLDAPDSAGKLPSIAGSFASGKSDTSDRADELLWKDPHA